MNRNKWLEFILDWTRRERANDNPGAPDDLLVKLIFEISEPASKIFTSTHLAETVLNKEGLQPVEYIDAHDIRKKLSSAELRSKLSDEDLAFAIFLWLQRRSSEPLPPEYEAWRSDLEEDLARGLEEAGGDMNWLMTEGKPKPDKE